jgi:hypothetical protein
MEGSITLICYIVYQVNEDLINSNFRIYYRLKDAKPIRGKVFSGSYVHLYHFALCLVGRAKGTLAV